MDEMGRDRTRREDKTGGQDGRMRRERNRRTRWEGEVGCGEALVGGLGRVWGFEEVRWWFVILVKTWVGPLFSVH
jgi:hypothetical protein